MLARMPILLTALLTAFLIVGCGSHAPETPEATTTAPEIEAVVETLYASLTNHDMAALRAVTTADFEIIDGGLRMTGPEFEAFITELHGQGLRLDFELSDFNTEIVDDVAYTSVRSLDRVSGRVFFESQILTRVDGGWLVDRFTSTPERPAG